MLTGSASSAEGPAHKCDDLIGGHLEVTASPQTFNELLAPGLASASSRRLD
jgi:hypothetical protein